MSDLDVLFQTMFFENTFLGLLIILVLVVMLFAMSRVHKYASVFLVPIALLFGFEYLVNAPNDSVVKWGFMAMFGIATFLVIDVYNNVK